MTTDSAKDKECCYIPAKTQDANTELQSQYFLGTDMETNGLKKTERFQEAEEEGPQDLAREYPIPASRS